MEKPSMESIEKLFNCMEEFYQERWTKTYDRWFPIHLAKTVWQSGLQGLNHEEIRGVLVLLKQAAKDPMAKPPNHLEFYNFAKGTAKVYINTRTEEDTRGDPEVARRAIAEIRAKLLHKSAIGCST